MVRTKATSICYKAPLTPHPLKMHPSCSKAASGFSSLSSFISTPYISGFVIPASQCEITCSILPSLYVCIVMYLLTLLSVFMNLWDLKCKCDHVGASACGPLYSLPPPPLLLLRSQGEAGTGNVVEAVRHARAVMGAIRQLQTMDDDELYVYAKELRAPVDLLRQTKALGRLPVVNFAAGGVATPADAALMMQVRPPPAPLPPPTHDAGATPTRPPPSAHS